MDMLYVEYSPDLCKQKQYNQNKMMTKVARIGGAMMVAALLLSACNGKKQDAAQTVHSVVVMTAGDVAGSEARQVNGTVKVKDVVDLGFKTPGQLTAVYVKEGQQVRQGQVIARLDTKDYRLGVEAAEAQYVQLKDEVARLKKLYAAKSISANDLEKATSGLQQAGVNLQVNRNKLSYTTLTAPVSGTIKAVNFTASEMVNAGTPVVQILATGQKEIEASLPEDLYMQRSHFGRVTATVNGRSYTLRLRNIVPDADNNQLFRAVFLIGGGEAVSEGMNASVTIHLTNSNAPQGLSLPPHAIAEKNGQSYVWIVDNDNIVRRRNIATNGMDADGNVIVTGGITPTDRIVRAGVNSLQDGEKVTVVKEPSETNVGNLL